MLWHVRNQITVFQILHSFLGPNSPSQPLLLPTLPPPPPSPYLLHAPNITAGALARVPEILRNQIEVNILQ